MMGTRGWTALVLPLTLMSVVYARVIHENGRMTMTMDNYTEGDKNLIRVNATTWPGNHESYAGYVKVDDAKDINLFFWFCLAKPEKRPNAPVLLWLNGGPGSTSLVGAFMENGPYQLNVNGSLTEREYAWTNEFNMLYVDNPVGVGYSYSSQGITHDKMEDVVENLYQLIMFMNSSVFPEYFRNGLYLGGQSYAGKYAPHLGVLIDNRNGQGSDIPLRGIYLGNALCDAVTMFPVYPDSLYHSGIISPKTREVYRANINDMLTKALDAGNFSANNMGIIFGVPKSTKQPLNSLLAPEESLTNSSSMVEAFMNQQSTQRIMNIGAAMNGKKYEAMNQVVGLKLLTTDFLNGTKEQNGLLMNKYKVLQYSGSMCLMLTTAMTDTFLATVDWDGKDEYNNVLYTPWLIEKNRLAGQVATVNRFTRVIVRNAGHDVPADKPQVALEMMKNFIYDLPFTKSVNDTDCIE